MMSVLEHLMEMRRRLIWCFFFYGLAFLPCYFLSHEIFIFLVRPLSNLLTPSSGRRLIYTGLAEAFTSYLKVAALSAFFLALPFITAQFWLFIAPGLYRNEKRIFLFCLITVPTLFLMGSFLAYYVVCPLAWNFFLSFETSGSASSLPIQLETRISEYLSLVIQLILAFGIFFQLPLCIVLLTKSGLIQKTTLQKNRKYIFLGIVILSALITPPDIFSPISLIVPVYGLYEIAIWLSPTQTYSFKPSQNSRTLEKKPSD